MGFRCCFASSLNPLLKYKSHHIGTGQGGLVVWADEGPCSIALVPEIARQRKPQKCTQIHSMQHHLEGRTYGKWVWEYNLPPKLHLQGDHAVLLMRVTEGAEN